MLRSTLPRRLLMRWLPEGALLLAFCYFALRKLDSFPAAWADDSLFMIVAKMVAEGRGYVLPILSYDWAHPYILAVGPTLISPVALAIKIGGFSITVARLPMVLYLLGATTVSYCYVRGIFGTTAARWNAALLISCSAFINTGKPVLGEIPGFFFLLCGLLILQTRKGVWWIAAGGCAFGLAVITKLPYGLIFPAIGAAWLIVLWERKWQEAKSLTIVGIAAGATLCAGAYWLGAFETGFFREIWLFFIERKATASPTQFVPIFHRPSELLRIVYAHYVFIALLATIGWWESHAMFRRSTHIMLAVLAILFAVYFLNGPGWYRQLLPSTLLLFLFLPYAARTLFGRRGAALLLSAVILAQGFWQFQYRGSSLSPGGTLAAEIIEEQWADTTMIIAQPEVFVRLPENPHWLFLSDELREASRRPPWLQKRMDEMKCLPVLRRVSREDTDTPLPSTTQVSGRYFLFSAPAHCSQ